MATSGTPPRGGTRSKQSTGGTGRSLVGQGMPSYRPMRSPLQSMGPSLLEERRRRFALRRGVSLGIAATVAIALVFVLVGWLGREVVVSGTKSQLQLASIGVATGPPQPVTLSVVKDAGQVESPTFRLALPINLRSVTAIGYSTSDDPQALSLAPQGDRANPSFWSRLTRRFLSTGQPSRLHYYVFGEQSQARSVCVGAPAGAQIYAPISGTVLSIAPQVVNDTKRGTVVQIQPLGDVDTVVNVANVSPDARLQVGETIAQSTSLLGTVVSMRGLDDQPLSKYTHDAGDCALITAQQIPQTGTAR